MRIAALVILLSLALVSCTTPGQAPDTVTITVPEASEPFTLFLAYQDGGGDWTELTSSNGEYRFEVTNRAGRYGVALVCYYTDEDEESLPYLEPIVLQATTSELSTLTLPCIDAIYAYPAQVDGTYLTGTVTNVDPVAYPKIYLDTSRVGHDLTTAILTDFSLGYLYDGVFDVVASVKDDDNDITRLVIEHDVEVKDGAGEATIDWNDSRDVQTFDLTIRGATPGDDIEVDSSLRTKNGTWASFTRIQESATATTQAATFSAAPQAVLAPGDLHSLYVITEDASGQARVVVRHFVEGEDLEVTLPEGSLNLEATPVTTAAYPRYELTWDDVDATLINTYISYETDEVDTGWEVFITPGWLTQNAYVLPDLSGLENWDPAWNAGPEDLDYAFNWFGAYFEPTQQALESSFYWEDWKEGEYRHLETLF